MTTDQITALFERDLDILATEIKSNKDENKLWLLDGEVNNSTGNLCLHLCGNLKTLHWC